MTEALPQILVALTVWSYWTGVLVMVVRSRVRYRRISGSLPQTRWERWMWLIWVPSIVLWQILPLIATRSGHALSSIPTAFAAHPAALALRWFAAGTAILAFTLTVPCWLKMGRNWSMAVVPSKTTRLVTDGIFARVRHPIYALSMVLMLSTMAVVPSPSMLIVGAVHLLMLILKASSEERYLRQRHGQRYVDYCRRTGRFLPRLTALADERDASDDGSQQHESPSSAIVGRWQPCGTKT